MTDRSDDGSSSRLSPRLRYNLLRVGRVVLVFLWLLLAWWLIGISVGVGVDAILRAGGWGPVPPLVSAVFTLFIAAVLVWQDVHTDRIAVFAVTTFVGFVVLGWVTHSLSPRLTGQWFVVARVALNWVAAALLGYAMAFCGLYADIKGRIVGRKDDVV